MEAEGKGTARLRDMPDGKVKEGNVEVGRREGGVKGRRAKQHLKHLQRARDLTLSAIPLILILTPLEMSFRGESRGLLQRGGQPLKWGSGCRNSLATS